MNRETRLNALAARKGRMLKVSCPSCGYTARVARKWLLKPGAPHCPAHGAMEVEAALNPQPAGEESGK